LNVPSIQIGLYTELLCLGKPVTPRETYQDFRFITAYAYKPDKTGIHRQTLRSVAKMLDADALRAWANDLFEPKIYCFRGRAESFVAKGDVVVTGRVNYFIGLNR
jgi:hypothetical protein